MNGYYIAKPIVMRRVGERHYFGSSPVEQPNFKPGELTPQHSLRFVEGLLQIAKAAAAESDERIYPAVVTSVATYSYPLLAAQAERAKRTAFGQFARELSQLGLDESYLFWIYYAALITLGPRVCNSAIRSAKRVLGSTPLLGRGERGPTG